MRKSWLALLCVTGGFAAGVVMSSHIWIQFSRAIAASVTAEYAQEQLALSNRASLESNNFAAALHARNAADAEVGVGFRWLQRNRSRSYSEWLLAPWLTLRDQHLLLSATDSPEARHGREIIAGLHRAQAAVSLERSICSASASSLWESATQLDRIWSDESRRQEARSLIPNRSALQVGEDNALLDSQTTDQLRRALSELRSKADAQGADPAAASRLTSY